MLSEEARKRKQERLKHLAKRANSAIDPVFLIASIGLLIWGVGLSAVAWKTTSFKLALAQLTCSAGGAYSLQKRKLGVRNALDEADDLLDVRSEDELEKEVNEVVHASLTQGVDTASVFLLTLQAPIWIAIPIILAHFIGVKVWIVNTIFIILFSPVVAACLVTYEKIRDWIVNRTQSIVTPVVSRLLDEIEENTPIL